MPLTSSINISVIPNKNIFYVASSWLAKREINERAAWRINALSNDILKSPSISSLSALKALTS